MIPPLPSPSSIPSLPSPSSPAPLFFCLRIPEFAAQALVRLRPALRKTAVAVLEGEPPLEKVCAVTTQATHLGLRHGMTRTEAESLPHLTLLRRSGSEENSAAATLLELAARFTPRTEELPRTLALTLALDMTGSERLLGPPQAIGQKLLRGARDLGLYARIAASGNLHTAACLTRAPGDTLQIVPPGEERIRLHDLPLSALDLTPELADTFHTWGLRSAGELAALPTVDVIARLGQEGHRLLRLARGEEPHLLLPAEPRFTLEEHLAFDAPVDNLESLLFVLGPMLDQLIVRARARALLLASVTVCLHLERTEDAADHDRNQDRNQTPSASQDLPTHQRTLKPALPLDDRTLLLKLLQLDLQAHPAPAAILAITLSAEPGPRPGVQSGLFSPQLPEPMRLEVTLARLAALVGEDRVGRAVLTDTHHPENFRIERLRLTEPTTNRTRMRKRPLPTEPSTEPTRTGISLRRLRPPRPIHVWHTEGRPSAFTANQSTNPARYTVQRAFGPWRCSGNWWSGIAWSHEEWDIDATAKDGTRLLCLLTHDLLYMRWQMEATYD